MFLDKIGALIYPGARTRYSGTNDSIRMATVAQSSLPIGIGVDAQAAAPFPFTLNMAGRKAQTWRVHNGHVDFVYADQVTGYIVEEGHDTNFSLNRASCAVDVQGAGGVQVAFSFGACDFAQGRCDLFCFVCDAQGKILSKKSIPFEGTQGQADIDLPPQARGMTFALRLSGAGGFSDAQVQVMRLAQDEGAPRAQFANAHPQAQKNMPPLSDLLGTCLKARNFAQGVMFADGADELDAQARRLRIQCNAGLHAFEHVIADFNMLDTRGQAHAGTRLHYMRALANTGQTDAVRALILSSCLDMHGTAARAEFMLYAYPFAVYISPDLADMVLARILASAAYFKKGHVNYLLRCAHDLLGQGRLQDAFTLSGLISTLDINTVNRCKLDILSAQAAYMQGHYDLQLQALNRVFTAQKAENLVCATETGAPMQFKDLSCPAVTPASVHGPLISVLMTTWNSAATVEYALRSLMRQSYADLEIIVIDDASSDDTCAIVQRLAQEDARIRLIALAQNGGTYVAKNTGLAQAQGVFVTCQDSDDWAHPQKIERNAAALAGNPKQIASAVQHVRYDPARGYRGLGGYIRFDASSMMFRRAEVVERIGYYDSVRVGGDSEYQFRLERCFGQGAFKQLPDMLSLVLWSENSLSGGGKFAIDDDAGIFTPFRNAYRNAFCKWQESTGNLYMPFPLSERLFDVPQDGLP